MNITDVFRYAIAMVRHRRSLAECIEIDRLIVSMRAYDYSLTPDDMSRLWHMATRGGKAGITQLDYFRFQVMHGASIEWLFHVYGDRA